MDELDEKVLDIQQRQKRAQIMRRYKSKIERAREIAKKRMAPESNIRKRAFVQARQIIRRRVAGSRGAEYEKLGPSEKMAIDRAVEGKQKAIKKLALRLIPRVKQAEAKRLHTFMKGQQIQNQGQPEGKSKESSGSSSVKESLNNLFQEAFPPVDASSAMGQRADNPIATSSKKMPSKDKSKNSNIIQYDKFQEEVEFDTPAFAALFKKSEKSGVDLETLGEVYNRGWNAWYEGSKVTQEQYAFARVNSFINQGKTYFNEDADLHEATIKSNKDGTTGSRGSTFSSASPNSYKIVSDKGEHLATAMNMKDPKYGGRTTHWHVTWHKDRHKDHPTSFQYMHQLKKHVKELNEDADLHEGRAPGTPSIKRYTRPDGTTALKSLNKWGKRKDWRDTEGGLAKAKEHAGVDKITESYSHLSTAELRAHGEDAIKKGDKQKVRDITAEVKRRIETKTNKPYVAPDKFSKKTASDYERLTGKKAPAHRVEEVQQTNENFIDGKGPGKPGDSARHGLKGKSAAELRKIRSSETASPRKKQLAHWLLNMHHSEETELDEKRGLWDNIHAKRRRIKAGSGERMRKPGSKGAPTKQDFKDASESYVNEEERPDPKIKVEGTNCRNCVYWRKDLEKPVTKEELNPNGGLKAPNKEYIAMSKRIDLGTLPGKDSGVKVKGFCDHDMIKDWVTERMCCSQWDSDGMIRDYKGQSPVMEADGESVLPQTTSKGSKIRKKIEVVDRKPPHTEYTRQAEIKHKIIDEKIGNVQNDPKKRLMGTDSLVKAYKADTPGQSLDESFNIAFAAGVGVTLTAADLGMKMQGGFALHPSVIEEMDDVEEEVRSADYKGVIVRTADGKTVLRKQKVDRKIIGTGNLTDGKPDDTV